MTGPFSLHRNAALRTGRRRLPPPEPVITLTVNSAVWRKALEIAEGDGRRIEIITATHVIVRED